MRTTLIAVLLACALPMPTQAQERPLPPPHTAQQLQDFVGQYVLEDGRVLNVTQRRRSLVAQLEGQDAVALQATAPAGFTGPDGTLRVAFDQQPNGNVVAVTVSIDQPAK